VTDPHCNGHRWVYDLGNTNGFKIDFPNHR
jgi:hypothetical protein